MPKTKKVVIQMLGDFDILINNKSAMTKSVRQQGLNRLLIFFLLNRGRVFSIDSLIEKVWPDKDYQDRNSIIRTQVFRLKRQLSRLIPELEYSLEFIHGGYCFVLLHKEVTLDLDIFQSLYDGLMALQDRSTEIALSICKEAVAMYHNGFLGDEKSDASWLVSRKHQYRHMWLRVVGALLKELNERRAYEEIIAICQNIQRYDDTEEIVNSAYEAALTNAGYRSEAFIQPKTRNTRPGRRTRSEELWAQRAQVEYERSAPEYNRSAPEYERPAAEYGRPAFEYERSAPEYARPEAEYNRPEAEYFRQPAAYQPQAQWRQPSLRTRHGDVHSGLGLPADYGEDSILRWIDGDNAGDAAAERAATVSKREQFLSQCSILRLCSERSSYTPYLCVIELAGEWGGDRSDAGAVGAGSQSASSATGGRHGAPGGDISRLADVVKYEFRRSDVICEWNDRQLLVLMACEKDFEGDLFHRRIREAVLREESELAAQSARSTQSAFPADKNTDAGDRLDADEHLKIRVLPIGKKAS